MLTTAVEIAAPGAMIDTSEAGRKVGLFRFCGVSFPAKSFPYQIVFLPAAREGRWCAAEPLTAIIDGISAAASLNRN